MSRRPFNVGQPNDGSGDTLRDAFVNVEANFLEIYTLLGNGQDLVEELATVATSGKYSDLAGRPPLGTASGASTDDFAAAAQGLPAGGTAGQQLVKLSDEDYDVQWVPVPDGSGAVDSVNDKSGAVVLTPDDLDDTETAHKFVTETEKGLIGTAVQPGALKTVATSGRYSDLTGRPALGTAAAENTDTFATAEQGTRADSAVQPDALAGVALTGAYEDLEGLPLLDSAAFAPVSQFAPVDHPHTAGEIDGLGTAATSSVDDFAAADHTHEAADIGGLGTAAAASIDDLATAQQGAKADTAIQGQPAGAAGRAVSKIVMATTADYVSTVSQNPGAVILEVDTY